VETQRTKRKQRREPCGPASIERGVRQLLADKVSGNMVGIWLLIPEYLRMGAWDLLQGFAERPGETLEPRLALQLVNEAALCTAGVRHGRSLSQKGFELANGLPFVAADQAIHDLLNAHSVAQAQDLQRALGRIRRASGHYAGRLLIIDPHHMRSHTKRQTRRHKHKQDEHAVKTLQTFFCLDADTKQPLGFTMGSSAKTATEGAKELLGLAQSILQAKPGQTLVLADKEHCRAALFEYVANRSPFELLAAKPSLKTQRENAKRNETDTFHEHWAGFATTTRAYRFSTSPERALHEIRQRCGESEAQYQYNSFVCTTARDEIQTLLEDYPNRWHIEEFFNANQDLGWKRAGTLNLNIRYGQATMALIAQAAIHQLRQRLGEPQNQWNAKHLAKDLFNGLDGDIRVIDDTIVVTFYNAPNAEQLRQHYENLPDKLEKEGVDPKIPWLYDFKLDFLFK
jgi:hypothetical protein